MDANEQRARELRDRYCPAGNYEHSDVLDAIMAALDMKPALSKPKVQTEHLWCTNCEGVHPESCFNATPSAQQVPADGEWRGLLEVAVCPNEDCVDGGYYGSHGEPTQCQWCYERKQALAAHGKPNA